MKELRPYLVVFSAIVTVLAFPPFPLGPIIFVSFVPLLYAIDGLAPYRSFKHGFLWGVVFYLGLLYYIGWVTVPGMIATVLILSLIPATAFWVYSRLAHRWPSLALAFIPAYFITWNWLFTKSDLNYPWTDFGYALSYYLPLAQAADIGGVYLLSLAIMCVNLLLFASISPRLSRNNSPKIWPRITAIMILMALYFYGIERIREIGKEKPEEDLTVGLIQGNITKDIKWNRDGLQVSFDRYLTLSQRAVQDGAELLIWPETAMPTYLVQEPHNLQRVRSFVDAIGVPLLTGVVSYETVGPREYVYFNSAILLEPDNPDFQLYNKIHLVPMSERIPFSGRYKILKDIHLGQADFSSGDSMLVFSTANEKFSTLICFESVFPGYTRQFARLGARFLVVITNDMWFGRTSLFEQHAMMSVIRAIENRLPVVRAANTGISMAADKTGRILAKSGIFKEDYLVVTIHPEESQSIYHDIGDVIPQASSVIALTCLIIAFLKKRENSYESYVE